MDNNTVRPAVFKGGGDHREDVKAGKHRGETMKKTGRQRRGAQGDQRKKSSKSDHGEERNPTVDSQIPAESASWQPGQAVSFWLVESKPSHKNSSFV